MKKLTATTKSGIKIRFEYSIPKSQFDYCEKDVIASIEGKSFATKMAVSPKSGMLYMTKEMLVQIGAPKSVIDYLKSNKVAASVNSTYEECKQAYYAAISLHYEENIRLSSYNGMPIGIWAIPKDKSNRGFQYMPPILSDELDKIGVTSRKFEDSLYKSANKGLLPESFLVEGGKYMWDGYEMTAVDNVIFSPAAAIEILPTLFPKAYKAIENEILAFEEAKKTNKRVLISSHAGDSAEYGEDESSTCDVYIWAMPDGKKETTVSHHY